MVQGGVRCSKIETDHVSGEYGFHRRDLFKCIGATVGMVGSISFIFIFIHEEAGGGIEIGTMKLDWVFF